jgi:gentisate 1,2-dioxygenase
MTEHQKRQPASGDEEAFRAALRKASVSALWERNVYPPRGEQPRIWRWREMTPLLDEAVARTTIETAQRRVLTMINHEVFGADDYVATTTNLSANLQILMPGEVAPPHRHSMGALRFMLEGRGAVTRVDGKDCPMEFGDVVLTPAMSWHEHANTGDERVIWLDLLDGPLIRTLDVVRFERGPANAYPALPPDAAFAAPGLVPDTDEASRRRSPLFRYPWAAAKPALDATTPAVDGSRRLRYTNPTNGRPVLNLIECWLVALAPGRPTRAFTTTANAVCLVVEGEGRSRIGEHEIAWERFDVFTLPHGHRTVHEAGKEGATLFVGSDREILRRLDLLEEQTED